jgi:hypothetical protein
VRRDMDLVRSLLLALENGPALAGDAPKIDGYDAETIAYHLLLMGEAGLMLVEDSTTFDGIDAMPIRLTWAGHEFLESVRDDSQWRSVKTQTEKAGGMVFDILKAVASAAMLRQLGM